MLKVVSKWLSPSFCLVVALARETFLQMGTEKEWCSNNLAIDSENCCGIFKS
jgi:hypothetical protein